MFVRMTHLNFPSDSAEKAKTVYLTEVAPAIRSQKGNIDTYLLEPSESGGDYISFSQWETEADLKAFETNVSYVGVIGKIREVVTKPPVQKYYSLAR